MLEKENFRLKKTFLMEQNIDNKIDFKSRITNFYKENKIKTQLFFIAIIIFFISITLLQVYYEKKNNQVSELFINAGIFYTQDEKDRSKKIYEDILESNNRFYSTLALNNIIEKNLENNDDKILEYFDTIEKLQKNKEQKDILKFKKALFLLKKFKNQEAKMILNELVKSDSKIKSLAEDMLAD